MTRPQAEAVGSAAVIGAGTIGASWAALFLSRGMKVSAWDPAAGTESRLRSFIEAAWPHLERLGLRPGASPDRLRVARTVEAACEGAEFVQENAPEREDLKVELLARIDRATDADIVIATSTSSFPVTRLQRECASPGRLVLGHPFNPPHLVPLVEVMAGEQTDADTVDWTAAFYRAVGKRPVVLKREIEWFIANRLQNALFREAIALIEGGVASVEDVDAAIAYGPGLRWALMGPILTFHLGGGPGGLEAFFAHFGAHNREGPAHNAGQPELGAELRQTLIDGVETETAGTPVATLVRERDDCLVAVIEALERCRRPGDAEGR